MLGRTDLDSREILQAGGKRVILDIEWRDGPGNKRRDGTDISPTGRLKLLLFREGGQLVITAHDGPPG